MVGLYAITTDDGPAFDTSEVEPDCSVGAGASELISSAGANVAGELAFGFGEEEGEEKGDLTAPPHCKDGQLLRQGWRLLAFLTCVMKDRTTKR